MKLCDNFCEQWNNLTEITAYFMNNLSSSEALGGLYQHSSTASSKANAELISLVDDDEDIDDDHHSTNDDDQEEVENNLTALLSKQQFLRGMQPTLPPQTFNINNNPKEYSEDAENKK